MQYLCTFVRGARVNDKIRSEVVFAASGIRACSDYLLFTRKFRCSRFLLLGLCCSGTVLFLRYVPTYFHQCTWRVKLRMFQIGGRWLLYSGYIVLVQILIGVAVS